MTSVRIESLTPEKEGEDEDTPEVIIINPNCKPAATGIRDRSRRVSTYFGGNLQNDKIVMIYIILTT